MKLVGKLLFLILLLLVLLLVMAFAALNPGAVTLDLAFATVDLQLSMAMTVVFAAGWLFGLLCAGVLLLRSVGERRRLRRVTEVAEAEVQALRSLPAHGTD